MSETTTQDDTTDGFQREEWAVLKGQMDAARAFWRLRGDTPTAARVSVCGQHWIADYGPLPCALPHGHDGPHRCFGSQGPIAFGPVQRRGGGQ